MVKLNGENTKYFHAKATKRYRHNVITSIQDESGNDLTDHSQKACAFWRCYKNRMGVSYPTNSHLDLSFLLSQVQGLHSLSEDISLKEIEGVVKFLKSDKVPGPDGFNGFFVKKCWHIIKKDFIQLCQDFHDEKISLESINGSYITLVPKKATPQSV